jgi:metal-responsive CopG/Arc/MetJ family transcriptional regulator
MSRTVTLSFAIPIEMSIEMNVYMETKGLNRSQLLKAAVRNFLDSHQKKESMPKTLNAVHKDVLEIKRMLCRNIKSD